MEHSWILYCSLGPASRVIIRSAWPSQLAARRSLMLCFVAIRLASRRHSSLGFASPGFAALLAWPCFATLSLASGHSSLGLFAWLRVVVLLGTPRPGRRATWHVFVPLRLTPEALRSLRRPSRRMTLSLVAEGGVPNTSSTRMRASRRDGLNQGRRRCGSP